MKIVHTADVHLDSPLRGLSIYDGAPLSELRGATRHAFDNLIQLAIDESASCLLIAGDLFDGSWRDYSTGLYFSKKLGMLRAAGIATVIIRGNHDAESKVVRSLRLPEGVHVLSSDAPETRVFDELGIAVHGQSFARIAESEDLAMGYPAPIRGAINFGLLHTALDGRRGHDRYAPTTVARLQDKGYDYWALGHVHHREIVSSDPYIVFPGNLQSRHLREAGVKGATVIELNNGGITSVTHAPLDVLRHLELDFDATGLSASAFWDEVEKMTNQRVRSLIESDLPRDLAQPLLAAARVTIRVRKGQELGRDFLLRPDALRNELRALAHQQFPDQLWIGDVRVVLIDDVTDFPANTSGIVDALHRARWSSETDHLLGEAAADLVQKLPDFLQATTSDADASFDESQRRAIFEDARELVLAKLAERKEADL